MQDTKPKLRDVKPVDHDAFLEMWQALVDSKPSEPGNRDMAASNWSRLMDSNHSLQCIVAVDEDDRAQGFTVFLALPFTFTTKDVCYLLDIYVRPAFRRLGYGRAMIEHLAQIGRDKNWWKIFWMTETGNDVAQRLYDKVATKMKYVRYDMIVSPP